MNATKKLTLVNKKGKPVRLEDKTQIPPTNPIINPKSKKRKFKLVTKHLDPCKHKRAGPNNWAKGSHAAKCNNKVNRSHETKHTIIRKESYKKQ